MKKYVHVIGASVLALAMSGLPVVALAENGSGEGQDGVNVQATVNVQGQDQKASESVREQQKQQQETTREQQKNQLEQDKNQIEASSSNEQKGNENMRGDVKEVTEVPEIDLELEDDSDVASSFDDLRQKIEVRKHELEQEVASTTEADKNIVENANEVRLAVHALLSSKNLVGGIGSEVSQIAKEINDSVATTTNAEAKIQSRSFLARLFFGGDSAAADVISQAVAKNQTRISDLAALLGEANVSADIQAILKAQITALQDAQTRLQALADKEQKMWGLFSWRF